MKYYVFTKLYFTKDHFKDVFQTFKPGFNSQDQFQSTNTEHLLPEISKIIIIIIIIIITIIIKSSTFCKSIPVIFYWLFQYAKTVKKIYGTVPALVVTIHTFLFVTIHTFVTIQLKILAPLIKNFFYLITVLLEKFINLFFFNQQQHFWKISTAAWNQVSVCLHIF